MFLKKLQEAFLIFFILPALVISAEHQAGKFRGRFT